MNTFLFHVYWEKDAGERGGVELHCVILKADLVEGLNTETETLTL